MKFLITGITGSLGSEVSRHLLSIGHSVTGFSRDELKQTQFATHEKLTMYIGDVRDRDRIIEAARGMDAIFHFAAIKHIDKAEENPEEAYKTNIDGTCNVLHAQRILGIPRVVFSSTDKAAYPINAYGVSKAAAERIVLRNGNNVVCRYGNVIASRGSVISKFVETLKKENKVYITDPNMTRFWISIEEAANFVIANGMGKVGGLKIPVMKAASTELIASVVATAMNINSYQTKYTSTRPGEKIHECLKTEYEGEEIHSHKVPTFTEKELLSIIEPIVKKLI